MKLTNNSTTAKYLKARMLADFDDGKFKALPLQFRFWYRLRRYKLPISVKYITFNKFRIACGYLASDFAMCDFMELTTSVNKNIFYKLKISLSLPLYKHYKSECDMIMQMFKEVGEEAPKAKVVVKDMQEFGLLPYVDYVADGDVSKHKDVDNMLVYEVYEIYKLKVHQSINTHANALANVKSH